jgi:hypothetical protein
LCRVVPQKIDVDCSDSIWRGKLENSSTNCAQNEFRCWALLRVVFSPLWRPGVPGSSRIYLSFPLKCKMVGGSDPGGRTTTVAAPIRIHHQRFPIQLRDWLIPARNLFPPNPAGTAGCHTTHDSVLRKARTYHTRCRLPVRIFQLLPSTNCGKLTRPNVQSIHRRTFALPATRPRRLTGCPSCVPSLSFASFPCIITPATLTFRFGHDLPRTLCIRSQDSSSTSHHRCQQASCWFPVANRL